MVTYIHNITLLITLTVLYTMVLQRVNKEELNGQIYSGILFGIFAILCMTTPFQIREGVIFDARSVILSIAGLFGGPITAALSITIASIYRFIIGGAGVVVGIFTIVQSGIIGVVFFHMFKKRVNRSLRNIFIMSVIIHIIMLISFLYIPNISFNIVINLLAVPTMIIYPLATVIISFIILEDNRKDKITEQIKISQKRLENIIEAAEVGTWEWNLKEDTKEYNNRWAEIIGYSLKEIKNYDGDIYKDRAHPKDFEKAKIEVGKLLNKEISYYDLDVRLRHKEGHWIWVNDRGKVTKWSRNKDPLLVSGTILDITSKKKEQDRLKLILEEHKAIVLSIDDKTGEIVYANRAAYDFYGYSEDELLSLSVYDICPLSKNKITEFMKKVQNNTQQFFTVPHCIKSGEVKMVDVYSSHVQYDNMSSLLSVIFDVTDREKAFEEVKNLAYHDYLTNTYNRRYLEEAFRRKNKEINCPISFIMADINGLKLVNDNYGHFIGDELIKKTAEIIKSIINDEAILARLGGDEFGVLYTQTTKDEIAKINSKLEDALESYIRVGNNVEIYLSVALGYATQSQEGSSLDYLMKTAESYLHRRKYLTERSMHSSMIHAMMSTLFLKSEREQMHSNRVGKYCAEIATALDWPRSKVNLVRVAGILHDIGKIGIDEKVLNKKAKLNEEEWALMKQHSVKSAKILDNVEEYKNLTQIVIAHHERFDGKGYPHKLKNDEIPIEARVIAVADAYDAMIEERPYKKSLTKKEAINELNENSGTQFDPLIVDIFINKVFPTH